MTHRRRRWLGPWLAGLGILALAGSLSAVAEPTRASCDALRRLSPDRDQWSYSELVAPAHSGQPTYHVRFASDPDYARKLQQCADRGLAFGGIRDAEALFSFRAANGKESAHGRRFQLTVPDGALGSLSGALAVQLETSKAGEIVAKRVLFATDPQLGQEVLRKIAGWITVASTGSEAGRFDDVLYLRIDAGSLATATESHRVIPAVSQRAPAGPAAKTSR